MQKGAIGAREQYSFIGIRQRHFEFEATTRMTFAPAETGDEAGLAIVQNDRSAFLLTLTMIEGEKVLRLSRSTRGKSKPLADVPFDGDSLFLRVSGDYLTYRTQYSADGTSWTDLGELDGTALSPAVIEGYNYTGVYIGLYASSNGGAVGNHADFDFFNYEPRANAQDDWFERQLRNE